MNRRAFIELLLSAAAASPLAALSFQTPAAARADLANLIDAHCHIFNGRDLPIRGFVDEVIISHSSRFKSLQPDLQSALLFYVRELAQWIHEHAADAKTEIQFLEKVRNGQAAPASRARLIERDRSHTADLVALLMDIAKWPPGDRMARQSLKGIGAYVPNVLVGLIHQHAFPQVYYAPVKGLGDGKPPPPGAQNFFTLTPEQWALPSALGPALYDSQEITGHFLRWMMQLTRFRFELAETLSDIHEDKARLVTPALVDFHHWLPGSIDVKLPDQIDAMAAVAKHFGRKRGGMRVHGYAAYDPLRQVLFDAGKETMSPFDSVTHAVTSQGFIGVKLYPPMGFRALDNTSIHDGDYFGADRQRELGIAQVGSKLDKALRQLYRWCEDHEVPILAHAAHSNGPTAGAEDRAAPDYWKLVIEEFPKIRICLAHFGHFDPPGARIADTWDWKVANLMAAKPDSRLYADISYLHPALPSGPNDGERHQAQRMFATTLAQFGEQLRTRLIYGSDWIMLGHEQQFSAGRGANSYDHHVTDFLARMTVPRPDNPKEPVPAFTDGQIEAVFARNASVFLGLTADQRENGTRGRLEKFYADNGLDANWLNSYQ